MVQSPTASRGFRKEGEDGTENDGKRILVYGAGVIGSVYALRFAEAGFAASLLARGERLAALPSGSRKTRLKAW